MLVNRLCSFDVVGLKKKNAHETKCERDVLPQRFAKRLGDDVPAHAVFHSLQSVFSIQNGSIF